MTKTGLHFMICETLMHKTGLHFMMC